MSKNDSETLKMIVKLSKIFDGFQFIVYHCTTMDEVRIIEIKKSVFEDNNLDADKLRQELKSKGVFLLNLMSSPGSGKTTTLIKTINAM